MISSRAAGRRIPTGKRRPDPAKLAELADRVQLAGEVDEDGAPLLDRESSAVLVLEGLAELARLDLDLDERGER